MNAGFLPIKRKFFQDEFWEEKREFSKAEAWLDLFQSACYTPGGKTRIIDNKSFKEERGQFIASLRFLQTRWGWKSKTKVETFLKLLEKRALIKVSKIQKISHITICYYDSKVELKANEKPAEGQSKGHQKDKVKEGNKFSNSSSNKILFSQTPYFNNPSLFKGQFTDQEYRFVDIDFYYQLLKTRSETHGYKYENWITAAKDWMLEDKRKNVLKTIEPKPIYTRSQKEQDAMFGETGENEAA